MGRLFSAAKLLLLHANPRRPGRRNSPARLRAFRPHGGLPVRPPSARLQKVAAVTGVRFQDGHGRSVNAVLSGSVEAVSATLRLSCSVPKDRHVLQPLRPEREVDRELLEQVFELVAAVGKRVALRCELFVLREKLVAVLDVPLVLDLGPSGPQRPAP
jgi:hypothetical protein